MKTVEVKLKDHSYPIYIGSGLISKTELFHPYVKGRQVMVVSNETVAPLYLEKILGSIQDAEVKSVILPDGEQYKNLETLNTVFDGLLKSHYSRQSVLLALGGGVVGDMTGFAAACYQRGVDFIQVPTTLLAQVDSSVGGKTGVNHALGKNMIGAFHQPVAVITDTDTLDTLEDRQMVAGMAEVIKYGLINDSDFYAWLESAMDKLMSRDKDALAYVIEQSCLNKARVVERDEKETNIRATLNLGHTFGHAIETITGYTKWLHGEGVGVGMLMAAEMSKKLGWLSSEDVNRVSGLLKKANLPTSIPKEISPQQMIEVMAVDKKVQNNKIRLVLLKAIGDAIITDDFDQDLLIETIETYRI